MTQLISKLNDIGQDYIDQSFRLINKQAFMWIISGNNLSDAINNRKNERQPIKVLQWMDNLWIYIEINCIPIKTKKKTYIPNIFFSLSIFQGAYEDKVKTQLFRAEWDNYNELSDHHPQPHWHFHSYKHPTKIPENFKELIDVTKKGDSFKEFITRSAEILDIKKFHFAMNGQWSENKPDVHNIQTYNQLINWFSGILNHIRKELLNIIEK
ncbi:MAG TPA: hypothetical protein ENG48_10690 [Candidatus Atribacteria bacterium]|nr:hypothetical protein [Candidatus Atribacteria bacterium]